MAFSCTVGWCRREEHVHGSRAFDLEKALEWKLMSAHSAAVMSDAGTPQLYDASDGCLKCVYREDRESIQKIY